MKLCTDVHLDCLPKGSFPSNEHNATSVDLLQSSQSSICIVRSFTFIRMLVAAPEVESIDSEKRCHER